MTVGPVRVVSVIYVLVVVVGVVPFWEVSVIHVLVVSVVRTLVGGFAVSAMHGSVGRVVAVLVVSVVGTLIVSCVSIPVLVLTMISSSCPCLSKYVNDKGVVTSGIFEMCQASCTERSGHNRPKNSDPGVQSRSE